MPTFLSMSIGCGFCGNGAPTHTNGMFKFLVIFSQTGEYAPCCESCARNGAKSDTTDTFYIQDAEGMADQL